MTLMAGNHTPTSEPPFLRKSAMQKENKKLSVKDKVLSDLLNILEQYNSEPISTTAPAIIHQIRHKSKKQYEDGPTEFEDAVAQFLEYGTAQPHMMSLDRMSGDKQSAGQDKGINHMDHCLRLALLRNALREGVEERKDTAKILSKTIVERWPVLAFMRKYNTDMKRNCWLRQQCSHKHQHAIYRDMSIPSIPFHLAVSKADHDLVKLMLDRIKSILRQRDLLQSPMVDSERRLGQDNENNLENVLDQLRYIEGPDMKADVFDLLYVVKGYASEESICHLAIKDSEYFETSEAARLKTLKELLTVKGIATSNDQGEPDGAFDEALKMRLDSAVIEFLNHGVPVTKSCLKSALENLKPPKRPSGGTAGQYPKAGDPGLTIVETLVSKATNDVLDYEIIRYIIKGNLTSVLNANIRKNLDDATKNYLLPTAVLYKSLGFIKLFVEENPQALGVAVKLPAGDGVPGGVSDGGDRFPLWYNNHDRDESVKNDVKFVLRKSRSDEVRSKIRDFLVDRMIRELPINTLSDILHRSYEPFHDLCFDISSFSSDNYSAFDFIESIFFQESQGGQQLIRFEKTLKYVAFPQFDVKPAGREMYQDNTNLRKLHKEVFEVLHWLKTKKGVNKIIELIVPDRLINPHDDVVMAYWLKEFGVEKLDWRVLDLSFTNLHDAYNQDTSDDSKDNYQGSKIRELHLYSSGKQSVLDHWFSPQGIESLNNLRKLRTHVVSETCTRIQVQRALNNIQLGIIGIRSRRPKNEHERLTMTDPDERPWYSTPAVADLAQITQSLSPRLAKMVQNLSSNVDTSIKEGKFKRTKVAILDNGILCVPPKLQASQPLPSGIEAHFSKYGTTSETIKAAQIPQPAREASVSNNIKQRISPENHDINEIKATSEKVEAAQSPNLARETPLSSNIQQRTSADKYDLWSRIKSGKSFVESSSRFNPWQFPSDAHGTQMANLICALDPYCELYVARVAETTVGINAANVAKAIDWAVDDHKVDIISMSFVVDSDPHEKLRKAVKKAIDSDVITLCSTHDEGSKVNKAWPASLFKDAKIDFQNLIVLAACDGYGQLLRHAEHDDYTYRIVGKDIRAGAVPFVKSTETISGSSVATAIAAGIASLTITGDGLANPGRKYRSKKVEEESSRQMRNLLNSTALPSRFDIVKKHLEAMVAEGSEKHILLEKFCKVGNSGVGKGHLYNDPYMPTAKEFLDEFRTEGEKKLNKQQFQMLNMNFTTPDDFKGGHML